MTIYEVNLEVDPGVAEAFAVWLAEHIDEMVESVPGFFRARWYERRPADEGRAGEQVVLWTVQYDVYTRDDLVRYFAHDAARMRQDGLDRFGGCFSASRRVLTPRSLGRAPAKLC